MGLPSQFRFEHPPVDVSHGPPVPLLIFPQNFCRTPSAPQSSLISHVSHTNLSNQLPFTTVTSMSDSPIVPLNVNRSDGQFKTSKSGSPINFSNSRPLFSLSRPVLTYLLYQRGEMALASIFYHHRFSLPSNYYLPHLFQIRFNLTPISTIHRRHTHTTQLTVYIHTYSQILTFNAYDPSPMKSS